MSRDDTYDNMAALHAAATGRERQTTASIGIQSAIPYKPWILSAGMPARNPAGGRSDSLRRASGKVLRSGVGSDLIRKSRASSSEVASTSPTQLCAAVTEDTVRDLARTLQG